MLAASRGQSRRRFLRAAAATGVAAGLGGVAAGQADETDWQTIELGGRSDGWIGRSPDEIQDEQNPTLALEAGETHEVTWENLDGIGHNFVVIDGAGNHLIESEIIAEEGATQTVEFEASEEMAEYYCGPHPQTMRGEISIGEPAADPEVDDEPERYFPEGPTVGVDPVAEGLVAPTDFADPDGSEYQFVTDQTGEIYAIGEDGREDEPWFDISDRMVAVAEDFYGDDYADPDQDYDERGLLGIVFHPDYAENGRFFLNYSAPPDEEMPESWSHVQVIAEFEADEAGGADPESERRLLELQQPQYNHDSGPIAFGPDGYLYIPTGDGGGADDRMEGHVADWYDDNEGGNGQNTTENLLGGVLRIDVDETGDADDRAYGIPDDNPFAAGGGLEGEGREEYYAWGLRNPFGITFSEDGRLIVGDAGQVLYEAAYEIERGGNYGWNVREGSHCFSTETPATPPAECPLETPDDVRGGEPLIDPVVEYPQVYDGQGVGIVIIGGHTYETDVIEGLEGKYIFGDWTSDQGRVQPLGRVFAAEPTDVPDVSEEREEFGGRPRDDLWDMEEVLFAGSEDGGFHHFVRMFGRGADGEVYVLANRRGVPEGDTGVVYELVPEGEGVAIEEPDDVLSDEDDPEEETENDVAPDEDGLEDEVENDGAPDDEDGAEDE